VESLRPAAASTTLQCVAVKLAPPAGAESSLCSVLIIGGWYWLQHFSSRTIGQVKNGTCFARMAGS
jgi:hypothetical protein